jgi:hypothetical protein
MQALQSLLELPCPSPKRDNATHRQGIFGPPSIWLNQGPDGNRSNENHRNLKCRILILIHVDSYTRNEVPKPDISGGHLAAAARGMLDAEQSAGLAADNEV